MACQSQQKDESSQFEAAIERKQNFVVNSHYNKDIGEVFRTRTRSNQR